MVLWEEESARPQAEPGRDNLLKFIHLLKLYLSFYAHEN